MLAVTVVLAVFNPSPCGHCRAKVARGCLAWPALRRQRVQVHQRYGSGTGEIDHEIHNSIGGNHRETIMDRLTIMAWGNLPVAQFILSSSVPSLIQVLPVIGGKSESFVIQVACGGKSNSPPLLFKFPHSKLLAPPSLGTTCACSPSLCPGPLSCFAVGSQVHSLRVE